MVGLVLLLFACTPPGEPSSIFHKPRIRWLVGLETPVTAAQISALEAVVAEYNSIQNENELVLEVLPPHAEDAYHAFIDIVKTWNVPEIVGPISLKTAREFQLVWMPLDDYQPDTNFDIGEYEGKLGDYYKTENGTFTYPFMISPSAIYYSPAKFDEAGLAYPPQVYGEKYLLDGQEVDWTWDTLAEVARRLTRDANGFYATQPEFDRMYLTQTGFSLDGQNVVSFASFFGAAKPYTGGPREYTAALPDEWKSALRWLYDGMWDPQPYMTNNDFYSGLEFEGFSSFGSGSSAMILSQAWLTCCLPPDVEFQLAVLPIVPDGQVHGRITEASFYVFKDTHYPEQAVDVLSYLLVPAADKLLPVYDGMSPRTNVNDQFIAERSEKYPLVTDESWNVLTQGGAYADIPSPQLNMPNRSYSVEHMDFVMRQLAYDRSLDFDTEFQKMQDDLTIIFNHEFIALP